MNVPKPKNSCPVPARLDRTSLLAVVPDDGERLQLERILNHCNWVVHRAGTLAEALNHLAMRETPVLICGSRLPDGDWRDLLAGVQRFPNPPRVILISDHDLPVWAELLSLGGYDLLEKPLAAQEFFHVVSSAWHDWRTKYEAPGQCPTLTMVA